MKSCGPFLKISLELMSWGGRGGAGTTPDREGLRQHQDSKVQRLTYGTQSKLHNAKQMTDSGNVRLRMLANRSIPDLYSQYVRQTLLEATMKRFDVGHQNRQSAMVRY
jgi:hypothetical protein